MKGDRLTGFPLMVIRALSGWPKTTAAVALEGNSMRCPGSSLILVFSPLFLTICTQVETCTSSTPSEAAAVLATADAALLVPVVANGVCAVAFGAGLVGACGTVVDDAVAVTDGTGVFVDAADALEEGAGVPLLGVAAESVDLFSLEAALLVADSFAVGAGTAAGSRLSFSTPIAISPAMAKATQPQGNVLDSRSSGGSEISATTSRRAGDGAGGGVVIASDDFTTMGSTDVFGSGAIAVDTLGSTSGAGASDVAASEGPASERGVSCAIASGTSTAGTSAAGGSRAGSVTPR